MELTPRQKYEFAICSYFGIMGFEKNFNIFVFLMKEAEEEGHIDARYFFENHKIKYGIDKEMNYFEVK